MPGAGTVTTVSAEPAMVLAQNHRARSADGPDASLRPGAGTSPRPVTAPTTPITVKNRRAPQGPGDPIRGG